MPFLAKKNEGDIKNYADERTIKVDIIMHKIWILCFIPSSLCIRYSSGYLLSHDGFFSIALKARWITCVRIRQTTLCATTVQSSARTALPIHLSTKFCVCRFMMHRAEIDEWLSNINSSMRQTATFYADPMTNGRSTNEIDTTWQT